MTDDLRARTDALLPRIEMHPSWRDSHGELNDAPNEAAALIRDYQAALSFYETRYRKIAQREADLINALSASEATVGKLREELAAAYIRLSGKSVHASDCATSSAPAKDPHPCDCQLKEASRDG